MTRADIDMWAHETRCRQDGFVLIAGMDEVGRGPLAGPVVAACVILPETFDPDGVNDSKKLTHKQRERAYERIVVDALSYGIGIVGVEEIDRLNILRASHFAMRLALEQLPQRPDVLLVDGLPVKELAEYNQRAIVGGDGLSVTIAAGSIIAKVTRDRIMVAAHETYPEYGFDKHKGYCCAQHMSALTEHGPCPIHRQSFAPVANWRRLL